MGAQQNQETQRAIDEMDAAAAAVTAAAVGPRRAKRAFGRWREVMANKEAEADAVRGASFPVCALRVGWGGA